MSIGIGDDVGFYETLAKASARRALADELREIGFSEADVRDELERLDYTGAEAQVIVSTPADDRYAYNGRDD